MSDSKPYPDAFRWLTPGEFVDVAQSLGMNAAEIEAAITPQSQDLQEKEASERPKNGQKRSFFKRGR